MDLENFEVEAKLFKALNHPVRLAILEIIREEEACVCHMEAILKLRQAYISQHLMTLREAGLVQDRRDGLNIYYRVCEPRIFLLIDTANQITKINRLHDRTHSTRIKKPVICDCPKCKLKANVFVAQELS